MIVLRDDQEEVRRKLRVALRKHRAVLVYAPTGFGKTVLAAALIRSMFDRGKRVIFAVHRVDLITQTAETFKHFGIPFSYIADGYHYNQYHRVFIASILTLKNRMEHIPADVIMVDEAHLSIAKSWLKVQRHYEDQDAYAIGFTGSPERLDGKPLREFWQDMVMGPSPRQLIEWGHLSKYRWFEPKGIEVANLHKKGQDYDNAEIDDIIAGKAVLAGLSSHWQKLANGKRTIGFANSVRSANLLAEHFRERGIVAVALDADTHQSDRKRAFEGFADRQIDIIFNCALFCEGFDLAAQIQRDVTIEAVLDAAPTMSLARFLQKHGRGLRKKPEPAILLDCVGGRIRHGLPDDEREWTLDGRSKNLSDEDMMVCDECFRTHDPAPKCPHCGYVYPKAKKGDGEGRAGLLQVDMDMEEFDVQQHRQEFEDETAASLKSGKFNGLNGNEIQVLERLLNQAITNGITSPEKWAAKIMTEQMVRRGRL